MIPSSHIDLIGSGFSDLGQQRYNWTNLLTQINKSVDDDNIRRAMARDENANNYFQNIAIMRRSDARENVARNLALKQYEDQRAQQAYADRVNEYRWNAQQRAADETRRIAQDQFNRDLQARTAADDAARLAQRAATVNQFAASGVDPASLPPELTAGLSPEHNATSKATFGLWNKEQERTKAEDEAAMAWAKNAITARRIDLGLNEWLKKDEGRALTKGIVDRTAQRKIYTDWLRENTASPPKLDVNELAEIANKNRALLKFDMDALQERMDLADIPDAPADAAPPVSAVNPQTSPQVQPQKPIRVVHPNGMVVEYDPVTRKPIRIVSGAVAKPAAIQPSENVNRYLMSGDGSNRYISGD